MKRWLFVHSKSRKQSMAEAWKKQRRVHREQMKEAAGLRVNQQAQRSDGFPAGLAGFQKQKKH